MLLSDVRDRLYKWVSPSCYTALPLHRIAFTFGLFCHARSEFDCEDKAIVTFLPHGRDGGGADFWIRFDRRQKSPCAYGPPAHILGVRYFAAANNVVEDLDVGAISDPLYTCAGTLGKYIRSPHPCAQGV